MPKEQKTRKSKKIGYPYVPSSQLPKQSGILFDATPSNINDVTSSQVPKQSGILFDATPSNINDITSSQVPKQSGIFFDDTPSNTNDVKSSPLPDVRGIFFDDTPLNIKDVEENCSEITSVLVKFTVKHENYTKIMVEKGNDYAILIKKYPEESYYVFNDGIDDTSRYTANIRSVYKWIEDNNDAMHKFVIFDWDKTLSVVEGMFSLHDVIERAPSIIEDESIQDAIKSNQIESAYEQLATKLLRSSLDYFLGGEERKNKIKEFINNLFDNNIQVYILTNNTTAISDRGFFEGMLKQLDDRLANNLLCTYKDAKSPDKQLKSKVIKDSILTKYTTTTTDNQSAGNSRNTKRRNTKRRNTKRRITKRRNTRKK